MEHICPQFPENVPVAQPKSPVASGQVAEHFVQVPINKSGFWKSAERDEQRYRGFIRALNQAAGLEWQRNAREVGAFWPFHVNMLCVSVYVFIGSAAAGGRQIGTMLLVGTWVSYANKIPTLCASWLFAQFECLSAACGMPAVALVKGAEERKSNLRQTSTRTATRLKGMA
ncbi:hypothetical protein [uncultured Tateyamaria sp.]|uniref:hypothetical protein n=1 Tax=uncultured Tateyamaria sp. TaxID=455651 RepID=UPI00261C2729|nr:hypothetical protein [uncultured Tateyamaria sp.]